MPTNPMSISVKTNTSVSVAGERVTITNLTRSGKIEGLLAKEGDFVVNPLDSYSDWASGDEVIAEIHGRLQGYAKKTLTAKGANFVLNDSADTSSAAVVL